MFNKIVYILLICSTFVFSQRIKDIAFLEGEKSQQVIGYGLVVGLAGSGDSHRSSMTMQSVKSMLERFGITVPATALKTKNVAAVMVTASIGSYLKPGSKFDVNVSSLGDARSLTGGTLLMTPLSGMDGQVYGMAQGPLSIGGYDIDTPTGNRISKNHSLAGRVPLGGQLQIPVSGNEVASNQIKLYLKSPDMTTSYNVSQAINTSFGNQIAKSVDASEVVIEIPGNMQDNRVAFVSQLEGLNVEMDYIAKVVLNERTGTVVSGSNVRIMPVTISHGSLNISIRSNPMLSQPGMFSGGQSIAFNNLIPTAVQDSSKTIAIDGATNIQEVAAALNSLKVSPRDIISIFQALKEAGALVAEIVII